MAAILSVDVIVEGWHCWPEAPVHRDYLASVHRHQFHVSASCELAQDAGDLDAHDFGEHLRSVLDGIGPGGQFGELGCAAIARRAAEDLAMLHNRWVSVTVSEDGEAAVEVEACPTMDFA